MNNINYLPPQNEQYHDYIHRLYPEENKQVLQITFQVTEDCCLACTYCYQHNKRKNKISFDIAKKVIDDLLNDKYDFINTNNANGLIIEFIGGEPFLEIKLIQQITDYYFTQAILKHHAWLLRTKISICSNGILYFNPEVQAYFKKYSSFISFCISIDGNKELHDSCRIDLNGNGSYDRAIAAVKHYRTNYKADINTKMTLAPENLIFLYPSIIDLINNGYTQISLNCVFENVWTDSDPIILYEELKKVADYLIDSNLYNKINLSIFDEKIGDSLPETENSNWCGGCLFDDRGNGFAIDYQGKIYSCIRYMDSSLNGKQPALHLGDIYHGIAYTNLEKENISKLSNITRKSQSTDECFYCPVASGCAWCSAFNYEETGTPNQRVIYICKMHKARVLANIYYWNKLYKTVNIDKYKQNNLSTEEIIQLIGEKNQLELENF